MYNVLKYFVTLQAGGWGGYLKKPLKKRVPYKRKTIYQNNTTRENILLEYNIAKDKIIILVISKTFLPL